MRSKEKLPADQKLQNLSLSIGNFIRYWGFRRIHGAIWTQIYLSKTPLSCTELSVKLDFSKALISPALDELCRYHLIFEAPAPNDKTKVYQANEDINEVIRHVLKAREAKMLKQITEDFSAFKNADTSGDTINADHVKSLEDMIVSANLMLEIMLQQKDLTKIPLGLGS